MTTRQQATAIVQFQASRAIATEWRFTPGAETGWHKHEHDYVIVPLLDGHLTIGTPDDVIDAQATAGRPYFREAGVEHNVINSGRDDFAFLEIELPNS